jgi:hypothetical protein
MNPILTRGDVMNNKVKLICCKTMMDEIEKMKPAEVAADYVEYALHRNPDKLREELQKRIDEEKEANVMVFVYGLCSRGLDGLKSGNKTLVIPRVHDCISLLLGSRARYEEEFGADPGTYYLSKGWIDQKADPYCEYEECVEKYGEENALWISQQSYQHYKRVAFIDTNLPELDDYVDYTKKVAEFLGVDYVAIQGRSDFFEQLVSGQWEKDFLVIPPGKNSYYQDFL